MHWDCGGSQDVGGSDCAVAAFMILKKGRHENRKIRRLGFGKAAFNQLGETGG